MPNHLKIYIIDDAMGLCQELKGWLAQAGHEVACSPAWRTLTHTLVTYQPQLIVLGVSSYSGEGMVLYRRLSNNRQLSQVPIIVVSVDSNLEYEMLDAFDFQVHPFDRERLAVSLERLSASRKNAPGIAFGETEWKEVKRFIHEHSGLHFSQHNHRILERGLLRRVQTLRMKDLTAYLRYLTAVPDNCDEMNKLLGLLTVGETSFFRYRSHREALLHYVVPRLLDQNRSQKKLRIWSAGCSTGEEPYSLAILLLENFPEISDWDVQILATDINKRSLRQARQGIYGERSLRMMEEELRQRYFEKVDNCYLLNARTRRLVRFDYLNLQTDVFPTESGSGGAIDLLFCRNVLIYFELQTIQKIVTQFSQTLKPQGYLFMGHSETMQNVSDRFQRHHQRNAFFYQLKDLSVVKSLAVKVQPKLPAPVKAVARVAQKPRKELPAAELLPQKSVAGRVEQAPERDPAQLYFDAMAAFDHEKFVESAKLFQILLEQQPKNPKALVGQGLIFANQGHYSDARIFCARAIKEDDLLPEAYLLRGLILDMEGLLERALVEYQKVLWLEPGFVMAHYLSAKIQDRLGNNEKQQRALRNAARALEQIPGQAMVSFSGGLSREVFLEIVHQELAEINVNRDSPSRP